MCQVVVSVLAVSTFLVVIGKASPLPVNTAKCSTSSDCDLGLYCQKSVGLCVSCVSICGEYGTHTLDACGRENNCRFYAPEVNKEKLDAGEEQQQCRMSTQCAAGFYCETVVQRCESCAVICRPPTMQQCIGNTNCFGFLTTVPANTSPKDVPGFIATDSPPLTTNSPVAIIVLSSVASSLLVIVVVLAVRCWYRLPILCLHEPNKTASVDPLSGPVSQEYDRNVSSQLVVTAQASLESDTSILQPLTSAS